MDKNYSISTKPFIFDAKEVPSAHPPQKLEPGDKVIHRILGFSKSLQVMKTNPVFRLEEIKDEPEATVFLLHEKEE